MNSIQFLFIRLIITIPESEKRVLQVKLKPLRKANEVLRLDRLGLIEPGEGPYDADRFPLPAIAGPNALTGQVGQNSFECPRAPRPTTAAPRPLDAPLRPPPR